MSATERPETPEIPETPETRTGLETSPTATEPREATVAAEAPNADQPMKPAVRAPSRRLSLPLEGRDYLDYLMLSERILFPGRLTPKQKDARILRLALELLRERLDGQEERCVPAERLRPRQ